MREVICAIAVIGCGATPLSKESTAPAPTTDASVTITATVATPTDGSDAGPAVADNTAQAHDTTPSLRVITTSDACTHCPHLALVFVVDRAQTLSGLPLDAVKNGIVDSIAKLASDDLVGVVSVDAHPTWIVPVRRADDRATIAAAVRRIQVGGTKDYAAALSATFQALQSAPKVKRAHVVVLGNGVVSSTNVRESAQSLAVEGMTVSAIGVGYSVDVVMMHLIADNGGGRFLDGSDPSKIAALMRQDLDEQLAHHE